jgi:hypothetical protein
MTDFEKVFPKTEEEVLEHLREAVSVDYESMEDGYNQTADTMWKAALVGFNYAAHLHGTTGFQASHAELMFVAKSRGIKGPFAIFKADDMLYPQYNLWERFQEWATSEGTRKWLKEEAKKKLEEKDLSVVHPNVLAHWKMLAEED